MIDQNKWMIAGAIGAADILAERIDAQQALTEPLRRWQDWYALGLLGAGLVIQMGRPGPMTGMFGDTALYVGTALTVSRIGGALARGELFPGGGGAAMIAPRIAAVPQPARYTPTPAPSAARNVII